MAHFYLDNDVRLSLADVLRRGGHTVVATRERRQARAWDDEQLLFAAEHDLTLITCNVKDFRLLHSAWCHWFRAAGITKEHAGILILEQSSAQEMAEAVEGLLRQQATPTNRLFEWHRSTGWYQHVISYE